MTSLITLSSCVIFATATFVMKASTILAVRTTILIAGNVVTLDLLSKFEGPNALNVRTPYFAGRFVSNYDGVAILHQGASLQDKCSCLQ